MAKFDPETATEKPRTLARRRQVLDAASLCFRKYGFHSSSMARISEESEMSVGHIYKYFKNKNEIIAAIVYEDVERILQKVSKFPKDGPNLKETLKEQVDEGVVDMSDPEKAALMLEIRAEAARSLAIRKVVSEADAKISQHLSEIIQAVVGRDLEPEDLTARVEMFQLIFQGIGLRTVMNPQIDRNAISKLVKISIDAILS